MIRDSLVCEGIELPGARVALYLTIPDFGVEPAKPLSESGKFFVGKIPNLVFDLLDPVHAKSITTMDEAGSNYPPASNPR